VCESLQKGGNKSGVYALGFEPINQEEFEVFHEDDALYAGETTSYGEEGTFPLSEKLSESGYTFSSFCPFFFLVNYRKFSLSKNLKSSLTICINIEIEMWFWCLSRRRPRVRSPSLPPK
jgi:hypothetical protein